MFRIKLIVPIVLLVFFWSCKNATTSVVPEMSREDIYREFIEALNTKDSIEVKNQIIKHWSDTLIGKDNRWLHTDLSYWLAANKEFGNLKFVSFGQDIFNDNEVAWCKGITTKDWVGLEFDFNHENKITNTNVLRSCIPTSYIEESPNGTTIDYSKVLGEYFNEANRKGLFSGMALIAKGDSIIYEGSHGYADILENQVLNTDHKMVIASTTKMFTAVAIAQLVEQNRIDMHEPISSYLQDFPKQIGDKVTIAHLLTHTAGIELDEMEGFMKEIEKARTVDELYSINLKYIPKLPAFANFSTLDNHDYSNENFDILGKLIEVMTGEDFYTYLYKNIFIPLEMHSTGPIDMNKDTSFLAQTYQLNREGSGALDNGFRDMVPHSNLSFSRPAGSFYSTPMDLYSFMKGLNNGQLIKSDLKEEFTSKKVETLNIPIYKSWYGYGFYINERYGLQNYGHAGGIPGVSSRCEYYPEKDVYVIVISNYNGAANLAANYISSILTQF